VTGVQTCALPIYPFDALHDFGADAIRWYFYSNSAPWLPNRFFGKAVTEGQRKLLSTLWNTYAFYVLYANIDEFDPTKYELDRNTLSLMDKWLFSKLNSLILEMDADLENYRIPEAARALQEFVDELSNWYVRTSRERFWAENLPEDKISAYMTLYTALVTVAKLAAPMIPFMCEDIYQNLVKSVDPSAPESVHLCAYPVPDKSFIDTKIESDMQTVMQAVSLGRAARNAVSIKIRQPLNNLYLMADAVLPSDDLDIIKSELNIKTVRLLDDASELTDYLFKPQLRILGQKYGKKINEIRTALAALDGSRAKKELDKNGSISLALSDETISLTPEELLIETKQKEGFESYSDGRITVVLDTELTDELIEEGFVREIISKIQYMRKEAGFEVTDYIHISQTGNDKITEIIKKNAEPIMSEVLATEIITQKIDGFTMEWDINGENTTLTVKVKA
jgi:isoleucyl-tRNA synthetase